MNIWAIKDKFDKLGIEIKILFTIMLISDENGVSKVEKEKISKYLKTTAQTVGKYLKNFVECDILKFKYNGKTMLNPDFYFNGSESARDNAKKLYQEFKSDIKIQ